MLEKLKNRVGSDLQISLKGKVMTSSHYFVMICIGRHQPINFMVGFAVAQDWSMALDPKNVEKYY